MSRVRVPSVKVSNVSDRFNSFIIKVEFPVKRGIGQVLFSRQDLPRAKALITGWLMRGGETYEDALREADRMILVALQSKMV